SGSVGSSGSVAGSGSSGSAAGRGAGSSGSGGGRGGAARGSTGRRAASVFAPDGPTLAAAPRTAEPPPALRALLSGTLPLRGVTADGERAVWGRWWLWTAAGLVVAAGVAGGVALALDARSATPPAADFGPYTVFK